MDKSRFFVPPDIWLDYRRAAWFPDQSILAVADLHLGYAWAHRHSGQLLPISVEEDATERLAQLVSEYRPKKTILLGDLVHAVLPLPRIEGELRGLCDRLCVVTELILVLGNHDRGLVKLANAIPSGLTFLREYKVGSRLFIHGDAEPSESVDLTIMGHEHPAISLGDGVATSRKFPCFLRSSRLLVLPAFSQWSAGSDIRSGFMSPLAKANRSGFTHAIAVLGRKLLPVPLG